MVCPGACFLVLSGRDVSHLTHAVPQEGATFPKASAERTPNDAVYFPRPKAFDGYKVGDSVSVKRVRHNRGYIKGVYVLPDKSRVYLVLAAGAEMPDFPKGISPWIETLTDADLNPPRVSWKLLPVAAKYSSMFFVLLLLCPDTCFFCRWWLSYDLSNLDCITGYWPAPTSGWKVGHYVSVPTSLIDKQIPRVLAKIVFVCEHKLLVDVVLPLDLAHPGQVFKRQIKMVNLIGPAIYGDNPASLLWPEEFDRPLSPIDLGSSAVGSFGKRIRVLSDSMACVQPVKIRKIDEPEFKPEPEFEMPEFEMPEFKPEPKPEPKPEVDVSSFFNDV